MRFYNFLHCIGAADELQSSITQIEIDLKQLSLDVEDAQCAVHAQEKDVKQKKEKLRKLLR